MFRQKKVIEPTPLDLNIAELHSELAGYSADEEAYDKVTDQLVKLYKLQKEITIPKPRVSPDVLVGAGINLLGILLVLKHEQLNVITSKAFGLVSKLR